MSRLSLYPVGALTIAAIVLDAPSVARACTPLPPRDFTLYAGDADDATPPAAPTVTATVQRIEGQGCTDDAPICGGNRDDRAGIALRVSTTDDRAPGEDIGYHVRFLGGETPRDLTIIDGPELAKNGTVWLPFDPDDSHDIELRLSVSAVDRNGNYSEPTLVTVAEDHLLSCSSQRVDSHAAIWLALGFVLWPRRRQRTTRGDR